MRALIDSLVADQDVTDVLISTDQGICVDRGRGLETVPSKKLFEPEVAQLAVDLISMGGRRLDPVQPFADVRLPGGLRVHAVLSPVAIRGTTIAIRISRAHKYRLHNLINSEFLTASQADFLLANIHSASNILITGGAGVGKTTLLAALLSEVPHHERIVSIEDVAELDISHPQHVSLETRPANVEGAGTISLAELIPQALRMRAERLVVGECRGPEWATLLGALNAGHAGGGTTIHANSINAVTARLFALGFLSGMSAALLTELVCGAFETVVHLERNRNGRFVSAVAHIRKNDGQLEISPILSLGRRAT